MNCQTADDADHGADQNPLRPASPDPAIVLRPLRRQLAPEIGDQPPRVLGLCCDLRPQLGYAGTQNTGTLAIRRPSCDGIAHGLLA